MAQAILAQVVRLGFQVFVRVDGHVFGSPNDLRLAVQHEISIRASQVSYGILLKVDLDLV